MRLFLLLGGLFAGLVHAAEPLTIDVYRDPNCGCCKAWIGHLQDNGFSVNDHLEADMPALKQRLGVPARPACSAATFAMPTRSSALARMATNRY